VPCQHHERRGLFSAARHIVRYNPNLFSIRKTRRGIGAVPTCGLPSVASTEVNCKASLGPNAYGIKALASPKWNWMYSSTAYAFISEMSINTPRKQRR
jgi:hypothetical protein